MKKVFLAIFSAIVALTISISAYADSQSCYTRCREGGGSHNECAQRCF